MACTQRNIAVWLMFGGSFHTHTQFTASLLQLNYITFYNTIMIIENDYYYIFTI